MAKARHLLSSILTVAYVAAVVVSPVSAQDRLPADNSSDDYGAYHPAPAYRESESHPLRILAYILHPIGWVARELIFRPLSYFASSTPETRAVMGYREPFDFRKPSCFSSDDTTPDCRKFAPFSDEKKKSDDGLDKLVVYFPDVNFDFDKRSLNGAGKDKAKVVFNMIRDGNFVDVELQGHADERGSDAYNMKLGMDRAKAVKAELVALGIPDSRLSTISFGERKPLFAEHSESAYAANRRVEVHATKGNNRGDTPEND